MKIATIRLQRNRKAKMMQPDFSKGAFETHFGWSGGLRHDKRIYSNDQDIDAHENARAAASGRNMPNDSTRIGARPYRGAARRGQITVPQRLHRALLERTAGRRGIAAMPGQEHVEPLAVMPERGARGRSGGYASQACGGDQACGCG